MNLRITGHLRGRPGFLGAGSVIEDSMQIEHIHLAAIYTSSSSSCMNPKGMRFCISDVQGISNHPTDCCIGLEEKGRAYKT